MSKITKAMATLGVVAGLGVAALPLGAYAADGPWMPTGEDVVAPYTQATSAQVQVEVEGAISISSNIDTIGSNGIITLGKSAATGDDTTIKAIMPGSITDEMKSPLKVTVSSNSEGAVFDLYVHTTNENGAMKGQRTGATIKGGVPDAGTEAWGYTHATTADATFPAYKAVPVLANADRVVTDDTTKAAADGAEASHFFKFIASTASTTPADTYNATVVFTAVAK